MTLVQDLAPAKPIHKPFQLASAWLFISSCIVIWDFMFVFCRPYSFKSMGGSMSWIWTGYDMYEFIDLVYSAQAWREHKGFNTAQSSMNVIEVTLNFLYLYLAHSGDPSKQSISPVIGLAGVLMTFSKTLLYFMNDYYCGWCESGHNDLRTWISLYLMTNGMWLVFPFFLTLRFGSELFNLLRAGAGLQQWNPVDHKAQHPNTKVKAI